jgi:Protein of unknown function (DUF2786)
MTRMIDSLNFNEENYYNISEEYPRLYRALEERHEWWHYNKLSYYLPREIASPFFHQTWNETFVKRLRRWANKIAKGAVPPRPPPQFRPLPPLQSGDHFAALRKVIADYDRAIATWHAVMTSPTKLRQLAEEIAQEIEARDKRRAAEREARQDEWATLTKQRQRIVKLRAKARDPAVTEAEASTFAAKADELERWLGEEG